MKKAGICLWMMLKRMGKHPAYWIILFLFPAAVFAVPGLNRGAQEKQITAGYVVAEGERAEPETETLYSGRGLTELLERKLAEEGLFCYVKYSDEHSMQEDIMTGKLSCGILFPEEFSERLADQDYYRCITLYVPEGMNVGGMVQEDIFRRVYQAYSAVWYAELMESMGCQIESEEVLQKFSEYQKEGKVFAVRYEVSEKSGKHAESVLSTAETAEGASVLSLRSVLAFLTLLSASLGALDAGRDRKRNIGKGMKQGLFGRSCNILYMAAAGAPILPAALLLAGGMLWNAAGMTCTPEMGNQTGLAVDIISAGSTQAQILPEIGSALLYALALWMLAVLAGRFVSVKLLMGVMPCFLFTVLLCCPIFFDLAQTIPFIGYLSNLFPITWYLRFWG